MARSIGSRRLALLAAAVLLLGQGAALHHRHEIAADHAPRPCVEHGSHAESAAPPAASASAADLCPFCEALGQGRTALPAVAAGTIALPGHAVRAPAPAAAVAPRPVPAGPGARAPPAFA